ncbi:MAG: cytochrome c family protein [Pseudomonadota bacterium]
MTALKTLMTKTCAAIGAVANGLSSFSRRYMHQGVLAAFILAGVIATLSGTISRMVVHPHVLHEDVVKIEAMSDGGAAGPAGPKGPEPILAMLATADVAKGEKIAKACAACHSFDKGGANGVGPNLWNTVGGNKQHAAGYAYSGALLAQGGDKWTYAELNKFLYKPKEYAPGTKMSYAGLKKPEDRAALLAWLRTKTDAAPAMPSDAEIAAEAPPPVPEAETPATETAGADAPAAPADAAPPAPAH